MQKKQKSLILVVDENNLTQVESNESGSFEELKICERSHIQEWIRKSPEVLDEELLVLSIEFDRFVQFNDRLEIFAMDKVGNLVVVEQKGDNMAGFADLQSLRYASMISTLTLKSVLPYYLDYNNKSYSENPIDITKAEELINDFVEGEFDDFTLKPRIILCSENFSTEHTTTVLWLRNPYGVEISCVRIKPHKVGNKIIIVPTLIIPIPEAKQYQIDIQQKEEIIHSEKTQRSRRPTSIRMLLEKNLIKVGDILQLCKDKLPSHLQPYYDGKQTEYYQVRVTGKSGKANNVEWLLDDKEYSISNVSHHVFVNLHPDKQHPGALSAADYWMAENGKTLYKCAS